MSGVTLSNVSKRYGALQVVHGVDLELGAGEPVAFVGPDGSGKLMVLRMIAGIEPPTSGTITYGADRPGGAGPVAAVVRHSDDLSPRRGVGDALLRGLRRSGLGEAEARRRIDRAMGDLGIAHLLCGRVGALGAGDRVQVNLARALATDPGLLVLDDPLAGLVGSERAALGARIARIAAARGITAILATDDRAEAMAFADRIVVFGCGRIVQAGPPGDLRRDPDSRFVATQVGAPETSFLAGRVRDGGLVVPALGGWLAVPHRLRRDGAAVSVGLRSECVSIASGDAFAVERRATPGGPSVAHLLAGTGERLAVSAGGHAGVAPGERVGIRFDPEDVLLFDDETGLRIR